MVDLDKEVVEVFEMNEGACVLVPRASSYTFNLTDNRSIKTNLSNIYISELNYKNPHC